MKTASSANIMNVPDARKALALVAILWVVAILAVIVAAVGRNSRLDTKLCLIRTQQLRCKWACRAGIETAIAVLNEDTRASDCLTDLWSENEDDFNDIGVEQCRFTVKVTDEAGKFNVNTATKEQLLTLHDMTEEIADAIIDWRDKDDAPQKAGAEAGYYQNLPYRYPIRNAPFQTIRELLMVKGITRQLLYGEDTNFNDRLDYNERNGDQSPPDDNGDDQLDKGWIAYLTCYSVDKNTDASGEKRININEADEKKLEESLKIEKSHAKWIVENRKNKKYKSIADLISDKSPKKAQKSSERNSDRAQPLDLETFSSVADKITVSNQNEVLGKVNINTAPKEVLTALLGGGEAAEQTADDIITYREELLYGMQSIAEIMNVSSVKIDTFKKIADYITTRSDVFTVHCFARADRSGAGGATLQAEAVVDRGSTPCKMLYWYQGANN